MSSPTASSSTVHLPEQRPEADPLPRKIGEFGYIPPTSPKSPEAPNANEQNPQSARSARHPADRDAPSSRASNATPDVNRPAVPSSPNSTTPSAKKAHWSLGGVSVISLLRISILLAFIGGTAAAWAIMITRFNAMADSAFGDGSTDGSSSDEPTSPSPQGGSSLETPFYGAPKFTTMVIVHVSFTVIVLLELLFLERSLFHARAERYLYKHGMQMGEVSASMGIAPWSRPPLPTYAAALAETGISTGDVEDNLIAIPPPPAYGNTRGSVLLLAGALRDSLIRARERNSQQSQRSAQTREVTPREMEEANPSRPISYDASEEVDNARRARELEAALARLERDASSRV